MENIQDGAIKCRHCNSILIAQQNNIYPNPQFNQQSNNKIHWTSFVALISGIIVILMAMTEPSGKWDSDAIVGGIIFGSVPIVFGIISIANDKNTRWMGITGLVLGILVVLVTFGSM